VHLDLKHNPTMRELEKALEPPSKDEIIQAQDIEIRRVRNHSEKLQRTAATIANVACALIYMLNQERPKQNGGPREEIMVPVDVRRKMQGAEMKLRITWSGDSFVDYVERADDVVFDGRPDE